MALRLLVLLGLFGFSSTARAATSIEEAEEQSQQTGKPILAVLGRDACGNTTALMKDLTNRSMASLVSSYVLLPIDVDKSDSGKWMRKYGQAQGTLPFVYVIRADGEKMFQNSGYIKSGDVRTLLKTESAKAGRHISEQERTALEKALAAAKEADASGNIAAAIKELKSASKVGALGSAPSFAKPVVEANKLVEGWTAKGKADLKAAEEQLSAADPKLDAALVYVRTKETFALLPGMKTELTDAARKLEKNRKLTDLLRQAEALHTARTLAATPNGKRKAIEAYQRIITANPNTEAGRVAGEEVEKVEKVEESVAGDGEK